MSRSLFYIAAIAALLAAAPVAAHSEHGSRSGWQDKFRPLDEIWPTPSSMRTASGTPGPDYWQQKVDYDMSVSLDDAKQRLSGQATITYTNNSPDTLRYLWLNLDQNHVLPNSDFINAQTSGTDGRMTFRNLRAQNIYDDTDMGLRVTEVTDPAGNTLPHTFSKTMMRVDLPAPLPPGGVFTFSVEWDVHLMDGKALAVRGGYEYFKDDDNYIYGVAQFYPRLAAYSDTDGWHIQAFDSSTEFTLEFGDFNVEITVPSDHIVASTGELQNPDAVLTARQKTRLKEARTAKKPVFVVTEDEATRNESSRARGTKTWNFSAKNVRDFAFASSRKFIWDAQGYQVAETGDDVMAMSFYSKESNPLWAQYSTPALIHTMDVYGKFAFPYPYPTVQSVNGVVGGGMEYPMLAFNGPRPEKDEKTGEVTYSRRTKSFLIGVIIHEAGHIWFPMIVNSDERQWTWLDEGLNSFLDNQAQYLWEENYPNLDEVNRITGYMKNPSTRPIMTNGASLGNRGANAYAKPTAALTILRETILGRELFDFAFKEYARRWKFKRATPYDFFRTMEDASGVDLDWFWRGWFYGANHVDISLNNVTAYTVNTQDPKIEKAFQRKQREREPDTLTEQRNADITKFSDTYKGLEDFYNEHDEFSVSNTDRNKYNALIKGLEDWQKELLEEDGNLYLMEFSNEGGVIMPVILEITYKGGGTEELRIPAQVWRQDPKSFAKMIVRDKEIISVEVDPQRETADTERANNYWPRLIEDKRLELYEYKRDRRDLMKDMNVPLKSGDDEEEDE
jgi:hypothetical protein